MKIVKKLINIGFAALLICASLFSVFKAVDINSSRSIEASAASNTDDLQKTTNPIEKNGFAFAPGAAVIKEAKADGSHRLNELSFSLLVKDQDLWDICDDENDFVQYTFTLYRRNLDGSDIEMSQKIIRTSYNSVMISSKNKGHFDGIFNFEDPIPSGLRAMDLTDDNLELYFSSLFPRETVEYYALNLDGKNNGNSNYGVDLAWQNNTNYFQYPYLRMVVKTQDLNTNYFVRLNIEVSDYVKTICKKKWYTAKDYYDVYNTYTDAGGKATKNVGPRFKSAGVKSYSYTTTIDSEVRSSVGILKSMKSHGMLEAELSKFPTVLTAAQTLLGYNVEKSVKIRYLKQIGNTHFAERVEEIKNLVVSNGTEDLTKLPTDRVASEFNNAESFYCISSPCEEFKLNSTLSTSNTLVYDAVYPNRIYLNVRTVDGNTAGEGTETAEKCYLDINETYEEFYKPFVDAGVFSQKLYEYMFALILDENKSLVGKTKSDLYGYWGYVVIPNTYTINEIWSKMFNTETSYGGIIKKFEYQEGLSFTAYNKLLKDFQYSWMERAWNSVEGFAEGMTWSANHYLFYADYSVKDTYLDEAGGNGSGDGAVIESVKDAMNKITQEASDAMNKLKEETADEVRFIKILLGIACGAALIAGGAYVVVKLKILYKTNIP